MSYGLRLHSQVYAWFELFHIMCTGIIDKQRAFEI